MSNIQGVYDNVGRKCKFCNKEWQLYHNMHHCVECNDLICYSCRSGVEGVARFRYCVPSENGCGEGYCATCKHECSTKAIKMATTLYNRCQLAYNERIKSVENNERIKYFNDFDKKWSDTIVEDFKTQGYFVHEFVNYKISKQSDYFVEWAKNQGFKVTSKMDKNVYTNFKTVTLTL